MPLCARRVRRPRAPNGARPNTSWCAALACAGWLLSSCASLPAQRAPADGLASNYAGRFSLAVTHPSIGGEDRREAWSGRFSLAVGTQSLSLDLVSPLGATIARFETDTQEARLVVPASGGVRVEHGADAQSLSERVLGWSLPITGMPDWIAGHPAKGRPFWTLPPLGADGADVVRQADGVASAGSAPDRFEQDGWRVTVERPDGDRAGLRLQMDRAAQDDSPAVALRVVLDTPAAPAGEAGARPGSQ